MAVVGYAGGVVPPARLEAAAHVFTDMRNLPELVTRLTSD